MPVAAKIIPRRGKVKSKFLLKMNICWISQLLTLVANQAMPKISPISPTRLYKTACRAAVFASARPCHQPISRKDMMPTPSQPINNWKRLLAETKISIATRNVKRYLKNRLMRGSECIYHVANSRMDQVT